MRTSEFEEVRTQYFNAMVQTRHAEYHIANLIRKISVKGISEKEFQVAVANLNEYTNLICNEIHAKGEYIRQSFVYS